MERENKTFIIKNNGYYNIIDTNDKLYLEEGIIACNPIDKLKKNIIKHEKTGWSVVDNYGVKVIKGYNNYVVYKPFLNIFICKDKADGIVKIFNSNGEGLLKDIKFNEYYDIIQSDIILMSVINKDNQLEYYTIDINFNLKKIILPEDFEPRRGNIEIINDFNAYFYVQDDKLYFNDFLNQKQIFIGEARQFYLSKEDFIKNNYINVTFKKIFSYFKSNYVNLDNGELILNKSYDSVIATPQSDTFIVNLDGKYNIIKDNKPVLEEWADFIYIEEFIDKDFVYIVRKGLKYKLINKNLNITSKEWYDGIERFGSINDSLFLVKINEKYNIINKNGILLLNENVEEIKNQTEDFDID